MLINYSCQTNIANIDIDNFGTFTHKHFHTLTLFISMKEIEEKQIVTDVAGVFRVEGPVRTWPFVSNFFTLYTLHLTL